MKKNVNKINVNDFEFDAEKVLFCTVCEEFVILRKGERSCKCTRTRNKDEFNIVLNSWIEKDEDILKSYKNCLSWRNFAGNSYICVNECSKKQRDHCSKELNASLII